MIFPESAHAHKWLDGLKGIEIGGAAHNPFGLDTVNVDNTADMETIYKLQEVKLCGEALPVDRVEDGETLVTFPDSSQDFIVSSHVMEHFANPLAALVAWRRVLRDKGLIYIIWPLPTALPADKGRPITTYGHLRWDYLTGETLETHPIPVGHPRGGHYHVFDAWHFAGAVRQFASDLADDENSPTFPFQVVDVLERDDKVGNGFAVVVRVHKS